MLALCCNKDKLCTWIFSAEIKVFGYLHSVFYYG